MTLMEFFGCTFIAFGPAFAMFVLTIARDPLRVIVLTASAFFWLLSLLVSSILWFAVVPLRQELAFGLVFSVIFQELMRFAFYTLLRKADQGLQKVSQQGQEGQTGVRVIDIDNPHIMAYVSGLGFGIMSGAFSLVNVLADMAGPGTIGLRGDSSMFFITSAFLTSCFVLLHTFWGVIFFASFDSKRYWQAGVVVASHMLVSCLTLLNNQKEPQYYGSLIPAYIVMTVTMIWAYFTADGSLVNLKTAFSFRRRMQYNLD
ncbi:gamma-secretase subunit Aph-1-like [Tubulanus polymorphus]|uniref:gamma-secretase subunit Aph-1-like n=1 Tax=Tubulanus polymorphus TaxID=672921 RepID=UPI003DA432A7